MTKVLLADEVAAALEARDVWLVASSLQIIPLIGRSDHSGRAFDRSADPSV